MPIRKFGAPEIEYNLIVFDENGQERQELDGTLLSETILTRLSDSHAPVSDVFLISHGWQGDIPAAIAQYDAWIGAMAASKQDLEAARARAGFEPEIVGLHWPSLPWGDETIPAASGLLSAEDPTGSIDADVGAYASRIADTPPARAAIRTILEAARLGSGSGPLPQDVREAYSTLFAESGLASHGVGASRAPIRKRSIRRGW